MLDPGCEGKSFARIIGGYPLLVERPCRIARGLSTLQQYDATQLAPESAGRFPSPFVKWAGGKGSLLLELVHHVPRSLSDYYEPFLGGGAVFFAIASRHARFNAHLSDVNRDLTAAYQVIKERSEELIQILSKLQEEYNGSDNKASYYYEKRGWRPSNPIETAARLIFLNRTCYNGLYRVNSRGEFNVPFGKHKNPRILDAENIHAVRKALNDTNARLESSDYRTALKNCRKNDFVYLDPPYQPKSKTSSFTDYSPTGFSESDQADLAKEFRRLVSLGCTVVLSNSDTPLTRRLYNNFETRSVVVNRPINSVASGRTGYKELIVLGNPCS